MEKANQRPNAGTAVPSNTGSSAQRGGLSNLHAIAADLEPDTTSEAPPIPNFDPKGCQCPSCLSGSMPFVYATAPKKMDTVWKPLPEKEPQSPKYTTFSGVTLDQTRSGQLSQFHVLQAGEDTIPPGEEWETMANKVGGVEKLESHVQIGLAAVRVSVGSAHLGGNGALVNHVSGFRLSRDLVVTCAHFTDWKIPANKVEYFLSGKNGVCEAVQAMAIWAGETNKNTFQLRLWAVHSAWDIAIFRITDWPKNDRKNRVVMQEHIHWATPDQSRTIETTPPYPFWSVGYNLYEELHELHNCFAKFYARRRDDEKAEIVRRYELNGANPPDRSFIKPDMRTVSFGTKIGQRAGAQIHQKCIELSAWHGRSGAMVCTEKDGSPVIIGLIQGGDSEHDCNDMLLFSTEMRDWWHAATDLTDTSDPQVISRRFVVG